MHAPAGDLLLFATRYGVRATNVFDTQLAAGFVGHGISMAYDRLVERVARRRRCSTTRRSATGRGAR